MTSLRPLRPYQIAAIQSGRQAFREGKRAILFVSPTGSGKTRLGAEFITNAVNKNLRVLWLAHRSELLTQTRDTVVGEGITDVGVISAALPHLRNPKAPVQIASLQTLQARDLAPPADLVIMDECVTGDTMIGDIRADQIKVGDMVPSCTDNGEIVFRRVVHVFNNPAKEILLIKVGNRSLACTPNHPVWAEGRGYVRADQIKAGDVCRVWGCDEEISAGKLDDVLLRHVPGCGTKEKVGQQNASMSGLCHLRKTDTEARSNAGVESDVQRGVREPEAFGDRRHNESKVRIGENEKEEPYAFGGIEREDDFEPKKQGASADLSRRQGDAHVATANTVAHGTDAAKQRLGERDLDRDGQEKTGVADALHDRHCSHGQHGGGRSGRIEPRCGAETAERCEKRRMAHLARVDSVEVLEPGSDGTFGGMCPKGIVYNFEVESEHNYFANGILTHNCHHYVASEWLKFANKYSHATRLGLTATPVRSDGTPLGDLFDELITVASIRDLTEQGYLVPCEVIGPDRHQGSQKLAQEPVAAWQQYARNLRTVVFARSVQHAKDLAEQFRAAGARATHVDGATPQVIREHTLDDFRRGKLDVLVNMFVLTEGFDAPGAECCLLARSCGSLGTYLQMVGRVLRPAPGKTKALLLDLPGVVHNHGMPDADREYSLDGEGIRSVKKPSLRQCKQCGAVHPPAPACPRCGHVYPVEDKTPSVTGVDLRKLSTADLNDDSKREAFVNMLKIAAARGYKPGWAFYRFVVKFNMKPPRSWGLHEEAAA